MSTTQAIGVGMLIGWFLAALLVAAISSWAAHEDRAVAPTPKRDRDEDRYEVITNPLPEPPHDWEADSYGLSWQLHGFEREEAQRIVYKAEVRKNGRYARSFYGDSAEKVAAEAADWVAERIALAREKKAYEEAATRYVVSTRLFD